MNAGAISNYDPVERAGHAARVVSRDDLRKYYRFRPARFYGGIATADCIGCCLRCIFCWSWQNMIAPQRFGRFYSPRDVARRLSSIAHKKGFHQMRISGNEPTISRNHLVKVIELVPKNILFILETNGILIGHDRTYADDLARYDNVYVRVSLKGCNEHQFARLTGADPNGFVLQLQALENLLRAGVNTHPAIMVSFSSKEDVESLRKRLGAIDKQLEKVEVEELMLYGDVEDRLRKAKIKYASAYLPDYTPMK